jgi:hypothetical protein
MAINRFESGERCLLRSGFVIGKEDMAFRRAVPRAAWGEGRV